MCLLTGFLDERHAMTFETSRETRRLAALHDLRVMGADPDPVIDGAARMAARLLDCPIALVSFVGEDIQWFKAHIGLDVCSTPRDQSFCALALDLDPGDVFVVDNAATDPRFSDNPLVTGEPHIRFYAGALLTGSDGCNLGTLCVIDTVPRVRPCDADLAALNDLAALVVREMERAHSERLLKEQRRQLDMVETISGIGLWTLDLATQKVTWSDGVFALHGLDPAGLTPEYEALLAAYHVDDRERVTSRIADAVDGKGPFEFEARLNGADGVQRHILAKGACEFAVDGHPMTLFGVIQDITEQREILARTQASETHYQLLTDHVADIIARLSLDGAITYISPSVERMLGYPAEAVAGQSAHAFLPEQDRALMDDTLSALAGGQDESTLEHQAVRVDGGLVWLETRFRLVSDERGAPVEIVLVSRDITGRKALEDQLQAARAEAEQAAAVKTDFLANMSHELRTPLTSILGFTALTTEQPDLPGLVRDYVGRIDNAGRALLCTVNDILDFSKLEAGQVAIRPEPTDVTALCRVTLDLFTPQAAAKDISLRLDVDSDARWLSVDPDRIRQILLNLVSNAVKFTQTGEVALTMRWQAGSGLRISVRDSGVGIASDKLDTLFRRFSQVDGALTRSQSGTGLGLAICKGLAEAMQGRIGAESVPGEGSDFWFEIPAAEANAPPGSAVGPTAASVLPEARLQILVADDHPANRELARLFLAGIGAEVHEAIDGSDAVAIAGEQAFDVILMDIRMPGLHGPAALARIRTGTGPNVMTPVLAYSADASEHDHAAFVEQGFCGSVSKPVSAIRLMEAIGQALSSRDGEVALPQAGLLRAIAR
ncbi:PAS domain S-box protein [soil metagenome]